MVASVASCKKEVDSKEEPKKPAYTNIDCNCGVVVFTAYVNDHRNDIRIKNNCTGHIKFTQTTDLGIAPGDEVCYNLDW